MREAPSQKHANEPAAKIIQALDAEREDAWGKLRPLVLLTASLSGSPTRTLLVQGCQRLKQFAMLKRAME